MITFQWGEPLIISYNITVYTQVADQFYLFAENLHTKSYMTLFIIRDPVMPLLGFFIITGK